MASYTGFRRMSRVSQGCVTLCRRLLVVVRSLCLVVLVSRRMFELHGDVLLFVVGCWLLCDHYVWSYWFSTLLVVHAFCTASRYGFLAVNLGYWGYIKENFSIFLLFGDLPSI